VAKSEVLIKMPEFRNDYELGMVEAEKISSRVKPKQFLHIDEAECILCEVVFDVCPWKCIFYLSLEAITDSLNVVEPDKEEAVIASRER
jgi:formate hydrogenlyase subunit 6/NADH:ubiquinone oxidoreductase subunit I